MASLAQLAEHALRKRMVVGSIPTGGLCGFVAQPSPCFAPRFGAMASIDRWTCAKCGRGERAGPIIPPIGQIELCGSRARRGEGGGIGLAGRGLSRSSHVPLGLGTASYAQILGGSAIAVVLDIAGRPQLRGHPSGAHGATRRGIGV